MKDILIRAVSILGLAGAVCVAASSVPGQAVTVTGSVQVVHGASNAGGKLDNASAVVWLKPASGAVSRSADGPASRPHFKIVQHHKRFEPHVLAVPAGSVVDFPNLDPFFHNVFSMFDGKRFDLGLYESGTSHGATFDTAGVCYIFCNIHPEMSAAVVVLDTPYYAVSNAAGEFSIPNVPPGRYFLFVWHERGKPQAAGEFPRDITIAAENATIRTIRLIDSGQLLVPHKNKYGRDYDPPKPGPVYK
ncbi:MAG TPA: carboxypeptidase regulatory-like domain-containing protein [Bryobacteraceae bacterium]|nr:carboxypeptidase regulatory-like domain-containing protein [Bryobacteraceae bacterium]